MFMMIALVSSKRRMGMMNEEAMRNLNMNVEIVDSQISFDEWMFSDSSDIWIPNASERESAIAIVRIPPMTTRTEFVLANNPIINPRVVMIPDVNPKLNPTLSECFICGF
jgi:hypothetical protein